MKGYSIKRQFHWHTKHWITSFQINLLDNQLCFNRYLIQWNILLRVFSPEAIHHNHPCYSFIHYLFIAPLIVVRHKPKLIPLRNKAKVQPLLSSCWLFIRVKMMYKNEYLTKRIFFFFFFLAAPMACRCSRARDRTCSTAASPAPTVTTPDP